MSAYPQNRRYQPRWWSSLSIGPMRIQFWFSLLVVHSFLISIQIYKTATNNKLKFKIKKRKQKNENEETVCDESKLTTEKCVESNGIFQQCTANPVRITAPIGINCVESSKYVST